VGERRETSVARWSALECQELGPTRNGLTVGWFYLEIECYRHMAAVCVQPGRSPSEGVCRGVRRRIARTAIPLRVVWEGTKRAGGGMASPLWDTPTTRSDEGSVCTRPRVGDGVRFYLTGWIARRLVQSPCLSSRRSCLVVVAID